MYPRHLILLCAFAVASNAFALEFAGSALLDQAINEAVSTEQIPGGVLIVGHGGQVVYRWHDGMLDRTVRVGDTETRRPININPENMSVEFVRPAGERAIVTVRTIEWPPHGSPRIAEISAALGGDAR